MEKRTFEDIKKYVEWQNHGEGSVLSAKTEQHFDDLGINVNAWNVKTDTDGDWWVVEGEGVPMNLYPQSAYYFGADEVYSFHMGLMQRMRAAQDEYNPEDFINAVTLEAEIAPQLFRKLKNIAILIDTAKEIEDFQAIGVQCRETLIELGNYIYKPMMSGDKEQPKASDFKHKAEYFVQFYLKGSDNADYRSIIKKITERFKWRKAMDRKIKTRQVHKDIKVLDKTVTVTDHVKQSYVRTKENIMQSTEKSSDRENNPVGYAEDAASEYADRIFHETGYQIRRQAEKLIERKKEKASVSSAGEETVYQLKEQIRPVPPSGGEKAQEQGKELAVKKIKTVERDKRTIKTGKASEQVVKNTGKGTIKTSGKSVKTAEQTAKTSIKTSEQTANASVRAMHYSMKKAEKAVQTARQTAQNTRIAVKKTAKAVTHAIKALIEATKALLSALTAGGWIAVMILIIVILFGGFLCMTGGDNSSTVSSVSAEVEAYELLIRQYANQYGIGEYVELIKAIMMQESGGRGLDPMQCSEGSFNTKYPRQPNGITDPEYSISCGVQEIKSCLERARVKNPLDMENIKLALQSYNYGNGYLEWAKARGGYTLANAAEFSDMMAQRMGWSSYGDKQYVPYVLQYYAFGRIPTGIGNQAIVQVAASQEGKGGTTYWSWYGFGSRVEWCACFVSWCADQSGYIQSGVIPKFSLCSDGVKWFESKGRFRDASYTPAAGDIIFFDWGNNGTIDQVGIVESVSGGTVNAIEGNSGDKVARRSYSIGSSNIYGYGVPAY